MKQFLQTGASSQDNQSVAQSTTAASAPDELPAGMRAWSSTQINFSNFSQHDFVDLKDQILLDNGSYMSLFSFQPFFGTQYYRSRSPPRVNDKWW